MRVARPVSYARRVDSAALRLSVVDRRGLVDKPLRGLGAVSPPAVRTRAHRVVAGSHVVLDFLKVHLSAQVDRYFRTRLDAGDEC